MDILQQGIDRPDNLLDQTGLCLLSLDGGGVRGLSTLYILKMLMSLLNYERHKAQLPTVKPCDVFDLIGGTSTGGLIAIMLGRLQMDVNECIAQYIDLMKTIFSEKSSRLPLSLMGKTKAQFDSKILERAIKKVLADSRVTENERFNDGSKRGCKVFVCAVAHETKGISRIRSYPLNGATDIPATVCEAALATSAATTFFEPVSIGVRKFVDGALGANNPVSHVEREASNIWFDRTGDLKPHVKCFISIGTGNPGKKPIERNVFKFTTETLSDLTTETESTATQFADQWRGQLDKHYFRFNVSQGLQDVGLAEYKHQGAIVAATDEYLDEPDVKFRMQDCAYNLCQKQGKTGANISTIITEHNLNLTLRSKTNTPKPLWIVPFPRNTDLVGRSRELDQLETKVFDNQQLTKVALTGLGGVGKTQIALELAYRTKAKRTGCSVFWVSAASGSDFETAYLEIGCLLQIPDVTDKSADVKRLVKNHLSQETAGDWLMILDNADDTNLWTKASSDTQHSTSLINHLPMSSKGSIIFTTRNRTLAFRMASTIVIEVARLDDDGGTELVRKKLYRPELADDQDILRLLDQLTFLPLAIVQATAYINQIDIPISEYLSLLDDSADDTIALLSEGFEDDDRYKGSNVPVATTWLVSFDHIRDDKPLAAEYLSFMSFLHPNNIPKSLLPPSPSKKDVVEAIGTLNAYNFISKRPSNSATSKEAFDLHRLVRLATRNWLKKEGSLTSWYAKVVTRLEKVFPPITEDRRATWTAYLPHAQSVLAVETGHLLHAHSVLEADLSKDSLRAKYDLLQKIGITKFAEGGYDEAEVMVSKVLEWRKKTLGIGDSSTYRTATCLTAILAASGDFVKAETQSQELCRITKENLGPHSRPGLESMLIQTEMYLLQGRNEEAEALSRQALKSPALKYHPSVYPRVIHTLSETLSAREKYKEAEELQTQLIEILSESEEYGGNHNVTLENKLLLATIYSHQGQHEAAVELAIEVVGLFSSMRKEGVRTLSAMTQLARIYRSAGRLDKAQEMLERALTSYEKVLGPMSALTMEPMWRLAAIYLEPTQLDKAAELQKRALKCCREAHGLKHSETLSAMSELARIQVDQGQLKGAEELLKSVLKIRSRVDSCRVVAVSILTDLYLRQRRYEEIEQVMKGMHEVDVRWPKIEKENALGSMVRLAFSYCCRGRHVESVEKMEHVVKLYQEILGPEHPETILSIGVLSKCREYGRTPTLI